MALLDLFELDEIYYNSELQECTYYFTGSADIIKEKYPGEYPEATATELSITILQDDENTENTNEQIDLPNIIIDLSLYYIYNRRIFFAI